MKLLASCLLCLAVAGCSTWRAPETIDDSALRARAETVTANDIRVSASVLSDEDNLDYFAANLNAMGIQSIWLEIENNSEHTLWLLQSGTDPDYFSPLEVAWSLHKPLAPGINEKIDAHFDRLQIVSLIPPGKTHSGLIYTNPHRGTRVLNIDLLGQRQIFPFTLFPPVPEDIDTGKVEQMDELVARAANHDYRDEAEFRRVLEQLPCCSTGRTGSGTGEPVNLVMVGKLTDLGAALVRRGYRRDPQAQDHLQRYYKRPPDLVMRKAGQGGVPANWLRLWVAPFLYQGQPVLLLQSGRPVGGRYRTEDSGPPVLHPNVDETRNLVIQDLLYSGGLAKLGFVEGVTPVSEEQWLNDPGTFSYHSDGLRAVLFVVTRPLSLSDVEILDWVPALKMQVEEAIESRSRENSGVRQTQ